MEDIRSVAHRGRLDPEVQAGRALRRLREVRNLTQEEVARRMKIYGYDFHQTTIAKIEAAQRPLRVRELADFAALYGVEVQALVYPPTGSLRENDQEIALTRTSLAMAKERMMAASRQLDSARAEMHRADEEYQVSARDVAALEGRLAALVNQRITLVGWDVDEEASRAESATPNQTD